MLRLVLALALAGCSSSKKATPAADRDAGPPTEPVAETPPPTPDAAVPDPLPVVDGVPPLTIAAVDASRAPAASKLNAEALALHRAGKFSEAIAIYKKALAADAGHLLARYNLACALVRAGEPRSGLSVLAAFADVDCAGCRERLERARVDEEWKTLLGNPEFEAIASLPPEVMVAGLADIQPRWPETLSKPAFTFHPRARLDRRPGFFKVPPLAIVARGPRGTVRAPFDPAARRGETVVGRARLSGVGRYDVRITAGRRVLWASLIDLVRTRCFNRSETYSVRPGDAGFSAPSDEPYYDGDHRVVVGTRFREDGDTEPDGMSVADLDEMPHPVVRFAWPHAWPADGVGEVAVIWRHEGKTVTTNSASVDTAEIKPDGCPIAAGAFELEPPASLELRPGSWKLFLITAADGGYEISFELRRGREVAGAPWSARAIAKTPAWATKELEELSAVPETWNGEGKPLSRRLIRAALRSEPVFKQLVALRAASAIDPDRRDALLAMAAKHGGPWKRSELPLAPGVPLQPVAADPVAQKISGTRCTARGCPLYPAMSPDGKILVTRDDEVVKYWDATDDCGHNTADFVRYHQLPSMTAIDSVDTTGFKPLACGGTPKLEAGHKIVYTDPDHGYGPFKIVNRGGKAVAEYDLDPPGLDICTSRGVRTVVLRESDNTTHCNEHASFRYLALTY